jgi:hypothetical protein
MPDDQTFSSPANKPDAWQEILPPVLIALGAVSLLRTSRFLSLALLGGWLYHTASKSDLSRRTHAIAKKAASRNIDLEIEDSFPASDPPSSSGSTAGAPD